MKSFPIDALRAQFPALAVEDAGRHRIHFDNPAGTQIPQRVIDAVSDAFVSAASNYGAPFAPSRRAEEIHAYAHQAMADMFGGNSGEEVIVAQSMTALTLHLSRSIGRQLKAGDEIIVTKMDHEGDVSPWLLMAEDVGAVIKWLPFDRETWRIEPADLQALLSERTKVLALNYASNLTGSINDVRTLVAMAREAGAYTYVDSVQLAPHVLMDVRDIGCDFMVCSSYKFFGPHLGILWGRKELLETLPAYKVRCASDDLPGKFETGTPQTEMLAGLGASVDYIASVGEQCGAGGSRRDQLTKGFEAATTYEMQLAGKLIEGLSAMKKVTIQGITNPNRFAERVPTVSFTHESVKPEAVSQRMAEKGICVHAGHNYAFEVVKHLGISTETGVVRIGLAHYNTREEVDATLQALEPLLA